MWCLIQIYSDFSVHTGYVGGGEPRGAGYVKGSVIWGNIWGLVTCVTVLWCNSGKYYQIIDDDYAITTSSLNME